MRLLWVSNHPAIINCGQSRVSREILKRFHARGIEVHAVEMGGQPVHSLPYKVHPWPYASRWDYPKATIEEVKPDVIVCSHDCWNFYWVKEAKKDFPTSKLVGYYTIDGEPIHGSWLHTMAPLDMVVSPTVFGKEAIYCRYPEKHIGVIPYGVDHSVFNLSKSKKESKQEIDVRTAAQRSDKAISLKDKCVFVYVGHNQSRKATACILDAFELANLPKSHLFMITGASKMQIGGWEGMGDYDLPDLLSTYETREKLTVTLSPTDDEMLASLYRGSDYFVLPSQGEAPGLPLLEASACGCVPIVTDYAGAPEVTPFGYKLPCTFFRGQFNVNRGIVSAEVLAETMACAYREWESGSEERSAKCVEFSKRFSWDQTASLWLAYLQGLLGGKTFLDVEVVKCL